MVTEVDVYGHEAHSSQPHRGASAIMAAGRLMAKITLSNLRHSYLPHPKGPEDYALKEIDLDWEDGGAYDEVVYRVGPIITCPGINEFLVVLFHIGQGYKKKFKIQELL